MGTRARRPGPEIITHLTGGLPALVTTVCDTIPSHGFTDPAALPELVTAAIDRYLDATISGDPTLNALRQPLLLSAVAQPLDRETGSVLAGIVGATADPADRTLTEGRDPGAGTDVGHLGETENERLHQFVGALFLSGTGVLAGAPAQARWDYPGVIRSALLRLAEAELPDLVSTYRSALIQHWLDTGQPSAALRLAADSEDWPLTTEILASNVQTLYSRDFPVTIHDSVISRIPEPYLDADPVLHLLWKLHMRFSAPKDILSMPERFDLAELRAMDSVAQFCYAVSLRTSGRFAEAAEIVELFVDEQVPDIHGLPDSDRDNKGFADLQVGITYLLAGRYEDALRAFRRARYYAVSGFITRDAAGKLALVHAMQGDRHEAQQWIDEEHRLPALSGPTEDFVRSASDLAKALLALDRLDIGSATRILTAVGPPEDFDEFWGFNLYLLGQHGLVNGTPVSNLRLLDRFISRFSAMRSNGAVAGPVLDALRADLHLASGNPEGAARLIADCTHPVTAPARARLAVLSGDPETALAVVDEAIINPEVTSRDILELSVAGAAAAVALDRRARAVELLDSAVRFSELSGLVRPFALLPEGVLRQLATLGPRIPSAAFAAATTAFAHAPTLGAGIDGSEPAPDAEQEEPTRTKPGSDLTERELDVLKALATGATVRQIASQSFVSTNTVKSQLASVYRKLQVNSRDAAVCVGREHGIID